MNSSVCIFWSENYIFNLLRLENFIIFPCSDSIIFPSHEPFLPFFRILHLLYPLNFNFSFIFWSLSFLSHFPLFCSSFFFPPKFWILYCSHLLYSTCSPNTFWQWVRLEFAFPLLYFQSNSSVSHVQCLVNLVLEIKQNFFYLHTLFGKQR